MEVLKVLGGSTDQAEAIAEAIIRHQDIGVDGTITFLGQLIQLATLYDNFGVKVSRILVAGSMRPLATASTTHSLVTVGVLGSRAQSARRCPTSLGATLHTFLNLISRWKRTL